MRVHEELLAPFTGLAPVGASVPLFKIVPDDFAEPARNAAMTSAVVFNTASKRNRNMRPVTLANFFVLILVLYYAPVGAVEVYERINEKGNVEYSDQPQPGSEPYHVSPVPTYKGPESIDMAPRSEVSGQGQRPSNDAKVDYTNLKIANIHNGEAIRANNGNVRVQLSLKPRLKVSRDHAFIIVLDGQKYWQGQQDAVQLTNLPRGQHTLTAKVVDGQGQELISTETLTFHVLRVSRLLPKG